MTRFAISSHCHTVLPIAESLAQAVYDYLTHLPYFRQYFAADWTANTDTLPIGIFFGLVGLSAFSLLITDYKKYATILDIERAE